MDMLSQGALNGLTYGRDHIVLFDDFLWMLSPHLWTNLASDANATVTADADGVGGTVEIFTGDAVDNNEAALVTTNELFLFAAGKPFVVETSLKFTQINTNAANVFFGLSDAIGANQMVDNGAGPKTTMSGAGIYAVDGSLLWKTVSSKSTTQTLNTSTVTAGGSSYQKLRIVGTCPDSANYEITYFVNGYPLFDSNGNQIKDSLAHSSATEMDFGVYAKAGGTGQLTVTVDYIYACFKR